MINIFKKTYEVLPNTIGVLYRNNVFEYELNAGYHKVLDLKNRTKLFLVPLTSQSIGVVNQEILTKDNIAFRFSFNITYKVENARKFLENISLEKLAYYGILSEVEDRLRTMIQIYFRKIISDIESEMLNEKRNEMVNLEEIQKQVEGWGIVVEQVEVKDITFPKVIQELFAKHLEAKIRAKAELENARTAVATARALKNASELMKGDENIKFFQMLETITKIASKGKHTFMIGDINKII